MKVPGRHQYVVAKGQEAMGEECKDTASSSRIFCTFRRLSEDLLAVLTSGGLLMLQPLQHRQGLWLSPTEIYES